MDSTHYGRLDTSVRHLALQAAWGAIIGSGLDWRDVQTGFGKRPWLVGA